MREHTVGQIDYRVIMSHFIDRIPRQTPHLIYLKPEKNLFASVGSSHSGFNLLLSEILCKSIVDLSAMLFCLENNQPNIYIYILGSSYFEKTVCKHDMNDQIYFLCFPNGFSGTHVLNNEIGNASNGLVTLHGTGYKEQESIRLTILGATSIKFWSVVKISG